jgi:hypothetical protein
LKGRIRFRVRVAQIGTPDLADEVVQPCGVRAQSGQGKKQRVTRERKLDQPDPESRARFEIEWFVPKIAPHRVDCGAFCVLLRRDSSRADFDRAGGIDHLKRNRHTGQPNEAGPKDFVMADDVADGGGQRSAVELTVDPDGNLGGEDPASHRVL